MRQKRLACRDLFEQTVALTAVSEDSFAGMATTQVGPFVEELTRTARRERKELVDRLATGELLEDDWQAPLAELAKQMRPRYLEKDS